MDSDPAAFKGQTVLITGASQGLGQVVFEFFDRQQARVFLTARSADKLAAFIKGAVYPNHHDCICADLTDVSSLHALCEAARAFAGTFDIVVHAAGGGYGFREPLISWQQQLTLMQVNLLSAIEINRLLLPSMIASQRGYIVHIGSIASSEAVASVGYNTAKSALKAYVRSIGREMAASNVVVSAILPGGFGAPDNAMERLKKHNPSAYQNFIQERLPRKKMGTAAELIPILALLCSEGASMMAGSCIPVDAGEGISY